MQFATRKSSPSSAGATYLNRDERVAALRRAVRRAQRAMPAIERAILFGSLASGRATPRSDADLLIALRTSPYANPRDRIADVLKALSPLPCVVDLFVWTTDELRREAAASPFLQTVARNGIDLIAPK